MVDFCRRYIPRNIGDTIAYMYCGRCYTATVVDVREDAYGGYYVLKFTDCEGVDIYRKHVGR